LLLTLAGGFPATLVALILIWTGSYAARVQWTLTVLVAGAWLGFSSAVRQRIVLTLQTVANLLAALRERDFSIRARRSEPVGSLDDPLNAVMFEVNELASTLQDQRLVAIEAGALLRTVMVEIDVAVFTFDGSQVLRLVNRAGERLLGQTTEQLLDRTSADLGLAGCLTGESPRIEQVAFPGGSGRFEIRRTTFRQEGRPHQLLVLADVSRPLRDEERQAWQRLIRVIGHEINNSLAPIKSIAGSLESMLTRDHLPDDWGDDMKRGLAVIATRSDALSRFTTAYSQLAKLPEPRLQTIRVREIVQRVAGVETRLAVRVDGGPDLTISADPDQLEQLLINLVRNAVDAALETGGGVRIGWRRSDRGLVLWVDDDGVGLPNASNLFVPFFTTKPGGSGIGLLLSRQIAEAHGGTLTLENRADGARASRASADAPSPSGGCRAELRLPV
jgi:PAS domain S-box-containing protein